VALRMPIESVGIELSSASIASSSDWPLRSDGAGGRNTTSAEGSTFASVCRACLWVAELGALNTEVADADGAGPEISCCWSAAAAADQHAGAIHSRAATSPLRTLLSPPSPRVCRPAQVSPRRQTSRAELRLLGSGGRRCPRCSGAEAIDRGELGSPRWRPR
jgi:hypothetical protein